MASYPAYSPNQGEILGYEQVASNNWRSNPNYKVTLYDNGNADGNNYVQAYLPENFHFRVQNAWEPFMSSVENVGSVINDVNKIAAAAGHSVNVKILSALVWTHMEPIEFSFTFLFDSQTSALDDVTRNVMKLVAMATPTRDSGPFGSIVLNGPGPNLVNSGKNISMKVGRFFYIDSVVINALDITWHTAAEGSGDFIAADVEIGLSGWYTPDRDDILNYFGLGNNNAVANWIKSNPTDFSQYANTTSGGQAPLVYDPGSLTDAFKAAAAALTPTDSPLGQQPAGG